MKRRLYLLVLSLVGLEPLVEETMLIVKSISSDGGILYVTDMFDVTYLMSIGVLLVHFADGSLQARIERSYRLEGNTVRVRFVESGHTRWITTFPELID